MNPKIVFLQALIGLINIACNVQSCFPIQQQKNNNK